MNFRWHVSHLLCKLAIFLLRLSGWYKGYWNNWRIFFAYAERRGLHILPVHYYSPVPDTTKLPSDLWNNIRWPVGFELRIDSALACLSELEEKYSVEYNKFSRERTETPTYYLNNPAFGSGDAEVLYALLREFKPRRVVEIGSGYSTLVICEALRANRREIPDYCCEFTAVEPYPSSILDPLPQEVTSLEAKPVQDVPMEIISALESGDVLFIDSSHVAKIGSDVIHEYLTILPNLAPGVLVHIHDVFIPAEYPRRWIDQMRFFWNEQYVLEAFLACNAEFEVIMPLHAIWRLHPEIYKRALPSYRFAGYEPSSFWIRRCHSPVVGTERR